MTHEEGSRVIGKANGADFQVASVVLSFLPGHISLKPEILKLLDQDLHSTKCHPPWVPSGIGA